LDQGADPRRKLADWLTAPDNPWFAKNVVNRIWFWLLGRGIVHEPDDLRPTNPPENPALLEYLEKELISHRYDLKHIYRLVLNSKTYQLSSEPNPLNEKDVAHFSHYQAKRLTAEQILDALSQITESPGRFRVFKRPNTAPDTAIPADVKAAQIAEASESSLLAAMFGRPERATGLERERAADVGAFHVQFLVNSNELEWSLGESPRIQRFFTAKKSDAEIVEEVFLAALSRFPKEAEKQKILQHFTQEKNNRNQAVNDLFWAVLNTDEFLLNH
jgi:DNA primase